MAVKRYPGFVDVHVHLREPGAAHKEDFATGTKAALKGGFTFIMDMPNNPEPIVSAARLEEKMAIADAKRVCDVGFHYGTNGRNIETFEAAWKNPRVFGLKIYCNHTTGEMLIEDRDLLENVFRGWNSAKPVLAHAEGPQLAMALELATTHGRRLHVCHISQASEVEMVRVAKSAGQAVSAGVCPHHLSLTGADRETMKGYAIMKPPLGSKEDQEALWEGLRDGTIDLVETDHAPHTREEKEGEKPTFGVPGLETAVGLLCKGIQEGRLPETALVTLLHENPKRIFNVPDQPDTYVELDMEKTYVAGEDGYQTKCGWSSFDGWELAGKIETVVFRGTSVIQHGKFI